MHPLTRRTEGPVVGYGRPPIPGADEAIFGDANGKGVGEGRLRGGGGGMIGQWGRMLVLMIWIVKRGENPGQSWRAGVETTIGKRR